MYLPVSILREWALVLSLEVGTRKWGGRLRYFSILNSCFNELGFPGARWTKLGCTGLQVFV